MDPDYRRKLEEQGYCFSGETTAVKICGWTKKSILNKGVCYKETFYGINAHRCCQMSPAVNFCDHDCIFCWRERNNSSFGKIDEPKKIIERSIDAQRKLLVGFKGNKKINKKLFEEAQDPIHFAISLNGEPTYYPKLNELIKELDKRNITSFVVSNGQLPSIIKKIKPTQLYISIDAPTKELYEIIDRPMRKDGWERLIETLTILKDKKKETRTVLRITLIKGLNDLLPEKWAELIKIAEPHFVEVKAFMLIGASRNRLNIKNMPYHKDIKEFASLISKFCDYKIVDEHKDSRVVLMMNPKIKVDRFLKFKKPYYHKPFTNDLPRFFENEKKELTVDEAEKLVIKK